MEAQGLNHSIAFQANLGPRQRDLQSAIAGNKNKVKQLLISQTLLFHVHIT